MGADEELVKRLKDDFSKAVEDIVEMDQALLECQEWMASKEAISLNSPAAAFSVMKERWPLLFASL